MARAKKPGAEGADQAAGDVQTSVRDATAQKFVTTKNFGYVEGHAHRHIPAGTELDGVKDRELIERMHRVGAAIEPI